MSGATYICGDGPTEKRSECPNALHDYPLPSAYVGASEEATRRLGSRWSNVRCPDCGLYGWRPGLRDADHPRTTPTGADDTNQEDA